MKREKRGVKKVIEDDRRKRDGKSGGRKVNKASLHCSSKSGKSTRSKSSSIVIAGKGVMLD